ncbi:MAG: hypothetical protein NTV87_09980 [Ignavibacteriae bacterium]|nr:hypothetical protein [Ignavibacteriota bacterium]
MVDIVLLTGNRYGVKSKKKRIIGNAYGVKSGKKKNRGNPMGNGKPIQKIRNYLE